MLHCAQMWQWQGYSRLCVNLAFEILLILGVNVATAILILGHINGPIQ